MTKIQHIQEQLISLSYCKPTVIQGDSNTLNALFTWNNLMVDLNSKLRRARIDIMRANNRVLQ
jgi:hypothetical protein